MRYSKIHPVFYPYIGDWYDRLHLDYEFLADMFGVSESRIQQIVLTERRKRKEVVGAYASSSGEQDEGDGSTAA